MDLSRRAVLLSAPLLPVAGAAAEVRFAAPVDDDRWNACIAWAGERMLMLNGVRVRHVRDAAAGVDLVSLPADSVPAGMHVVGPWRVRGWIAVHSPKRVTNRVARAATLAEARALFVRHAASCYLACNPGEAACGIARRILPSSVRAMRLAPVWRDVLLLASPRPAAILVARFLLSAEAQAHLPTPGIAAHLG